MSSTYRILCLSHDPAIELEPEWSDSAEAMLRATDPAAEECTATHAGCDLLVGRFSYPLIEVGCPPMNARGVTRFHLGGRYHSGEQWVDTDWLRLLHAARGLRDGGDFSGILGRFGQSCWTPTRLDRLREYLTLP